MAKQEINHTNVYLIQMKLSFTADALALDNVDTTNAAS